MHDKFVPSAEAARGVGKGSGGGKQFFSRLVQAPTGSAFVREMPDKLSGKSVNVGTSKIVELFTSKAENTGSADVRDLEALAVEDISIHGNPLFAFPVQPQIHQPPHFLVLFVCRFFVNPRRSLNSDYDGAF